MSAETLKTASGEPIQGPLLITPQVFGDSRGYFLRAGMSDVSAPNSSLQDVSKMRFRPSDSGKTITLVQVVVF